MKRAWVVLGLVAGLGLLASEASAQHGSARGKVVDEKGEPVKDAKVEIEFLGGVTQKYETKTDKKGEFIQVGMNAKSLALPSVVPEMNHNEIMAPPLPLPVCQQLRMLCLADAADPEPVARRLALTAELLAAYVAGTEVLAETAAEPLAPLLGATLLADYTSLYLAFLHRVDPLPVARIQDFKARLRASG